MIKLVKILKDNNISYFKIYNDLFNVTRNSFMLKIALKTDFTILELNKIKNYLISLNIIDEDFDIGEFLEDVWLFFFFGNNNQVVGKW